MRLGMRLSGTSVATYNNQVGMKGCLLNCILELYNALRSLGELTSCIICS